jgi:DNA/RNA endonuclease YhcR with UshA esterase domain
MNRTVLVVCLALLAAPAFAQEANISTNLPVRITAREAKDHLNAQAIVTGKVAEVNKAASLVRLNFEQPYPKQVFTAVIFAAKTNLFPELEKLQGKTVEISGRIADYRGRPQIILTSTNQLKIVEKSAQPANPPDAKSP